GIRWRPSRLEAEPLPQVEALVGGERGELRYLERQSRQRHAVVVGPPGLGEVDDRAVRVPVPGPLVEPPVHTGRLGHHADPGRTDRDHLAVALHAPELLGDLAGRAGDEVAGGVYLGDQLAGAGTVRPGQDDLGLVLPDVHGDDPLGELRPVLLAGRGVALGYHREQRVEQHRTLGVARAAG